MVSLLADTESVLLRVGAAAFALTAILALVNLIMIRPLRHWVDETRHKDIDKAVDNHEEKHHRHRKRQL